MILIELERALKEKAADWAKGAGAPAPESLPLSAPPPHVAADLSLPWAMTLAKARRANPLQTAKSLSELFASLPSVESALAAPPGFVNLRIKTQALCENAAELIKAPSSYGRDPGSKKRSVLFEFVSANPTGPLHLASGRGAGLGDSMVRIFRRLGHKVWAEYYVNDAGRQVELLGLSLLARRRGAEPPEDGYQGDYVTALAKSFPPEADSWSADEFRKRGIEALLKTHREDMELFGVTFDRWFRESELHAKDALQKSLDKLKSRGMVYEKEKAVWLGTASSGSEDDKDRVLIRADGRPTYFLADIAYHEDKYARSGGELVDILGTDHHGYVPRLRAAMEALGHPPDTFHPIVHQLIRLHRGDQPVKMSKRAGEFVTLKEIIDEVGRDACRFFFALRTPDSHMNFDLELAKKQSSENPVYYCQYVHARVASIFREAEKAGLKAAPSPSECAELLKTPEERALLVKIAWLPEILKACEKELSPHLLANYVLELAGLFHPFYEKCRVLDAANPELSRARLFLCAAVKDAIRESLGTLGVSAPERM